jgi:hypothetical protein
MVADEPDANAFRLGAVLKSPGYAKRSENSHGADWVMTMDGITCTAFADFASVHRPGSTGDPHEMQPSGTDDLVGLGLRDGCDSRRTTSGGSRGARGYGGSTVPIPDESPHSGFVVDWGDGG